MSLLISPREGMMSFLDERAAFEAELEAFYGQTPTTMAALEDELLALGAAHPELSPARQKALGYAVIAERCPVKVFRHFPFYCEIDVGKPRTDLGAGGVGGWLKRTPFGQALEAQGRTWWDLCWQEGLSMGWWVLDDNHHSIGNDNVFQFGLNGLLQQAQQRLVTAETDEQRDFLTAMCDGLRAEVRVAERFAEEAERLLPDETDPAVCTRLRRIAAAARRSPAEPPADFFEAVNTILFMREVTQAIEANGNSIYGHLDRILWPYYERDLAEGRLTREEAKDLLRYLMAYSDVRFGMRHQQWEHVGTNTTVIIGGCDREGTPVFNELTRMIVEIRMELKYVDPKINARISSRHPRAYFQLLAELTASGDNGVAIFNDDVIIPANEKMGKALEDCRLYVGGGCQENLLENCEVNSRASIYLNLLQVFLAGFFPERLARFTAREGIVPRLYEDCADFEAFYAAFLENLRAVNDAHIDQRNLTEAQGWRYHPCPLHSATIGDCIEKAQDMLGGGARYSFGSVSLTGVGTLVDSLYAVREVVFNQGKLTLAQLRELLADDFAGEEATRLYLARRVPKYGQEHPDVEVFAARVFADLARVTSGKPNTRGGRYEASLFPFRVFVPMGKVTGATPDGRRAGEHLSPGMSPSPLALGPECSIGQVLDALKPLDLTLYPVVAVLDVKLPALRQIAPDVLVPVLTRFVANGGSVLQINYVDPDILLEAKAHPERHPDLIVRISGYSAYFNTLPEALQDEVIARTLVTA